MGNEARKGANEAWFRELNERIELRAASAPEASGSFEIVCECAREECTERIEIGFGSYESVRRDPTAFIVVAGHSDPTCERVMSECGPYQVVEKFGIAGAVAEERDRRDGSDA